jgi:hypothetical protein
MAVAPPLAHAEVLRRYMALLVRKGTDTRLNVAVHTWDGVDGGSRNVYHGHYLVGKVTETSDEDIR